MVALLPTFVAIAAIASALALAIRFAIPRGRARPVRAAVLLRALLPTRLIRTASGRADIAYFLFGALFAGSLLAWALVSADWARQLVASALPDPGEALLPAWAASAAMTLALYLAYEFAYWLFHWLSHRVPALWAFHKVHHSAESLLPLTNYRVHPIDSILFYNTAAAIMGMVAALVDHGLGGRIEGWAVAASNALVFVTTIVLTQLQHTHLWISMPGRWGDWLITPAHHQLHHSLNPVHFDRNFGSNLAIFDRLFGTLHKPRRARERLGFGVAWLGERAHGPSGLVLDPFVEAAGTLAPRPATARLSRPA